MFGPLFYTWCLANVGLAALAAQLHGRRVPIRVLNGTSYRIIQVNMIQYIYIRIYDTV